MVMWHESQIWVQGLSREGGKEAETSLTKVQQGSLVAFACWIHRVQPLGLRERIRKHTTSQRTGNLWVKLGSASKTISASYCHSWSTAFLRAVLSPSDLVISEKRGMTWPFSMEHFWASANSPASLLGANSLRNFWLLAEAEFIHRS